jgi:hypothetical protein
MPEPARIVVGPEERRYVKWLELKAQKRDLEHHRVDLAAEFAAIAVAGLIRAGWEVTCPERENIFRDLAPGELERLRSK